MAEGVPVPFLKKKMLPVTAQDIRQKLEAYCFSRLALDILQ